MKRFVNAFDFETLSLNGEINNEPSETVPDMTMSLSEILKRYTRGGEVATFTPVYQNHDDFDENPEFEKMDATEKLQMALDLKMAIKRHQATAENQTVAKPQNPPAPPEVEPSQSEEAQPQAERNSHNSP